MSTRLERLQALVDRGATPGERAAAARALAVHQAKQPVRVLPPPVEAKPVGPDITRAGRPFRGKIDWDEKLWVAVPSSPLVSAQQKAKLWVEDRCRMLVIVAGERMAMIPTAVEVDEVDDERQQVFVTADVADLKPWSEPA